MFGGLLIFASPKIVQDFAYSSLIRIICTAKGSLFVLGYEWHKFEVWYMFKV